MILTTGEGARNGGKAPEFNSLNYLGRLYEGSDEWTVKIFSMSELSDEWLSTMFDGKVGWVLRKEVRSLTLSMFWTLIFLRT